MTSFDVDIMSSFSNSRHHASATLDFWIFPTLQETTKNASKVFKKKKIQESYFPYQTVLDKVHVTSFVHSCVISMVVMVVVFTLSCWGHLFILGLISRFIDRFSLSFSEGRERSTVASYNPTCSFRWAFFVSNLFSENHVVFKIFVYH